MDNQLKETIVGAGEAAGCALEFTLVHMAITTFPPMIFIPIAAFWIQAFASLIAMLWVRMRYSSPVKTKVKKGPQKPLVLRIIALVVLPLLAYTAALALALWEEDTLKIGLFNVPQNLFSSPSDSIARLFAQFFACGKPCVVNLLFLSPICEEVVFRRLVPQTIACHQGEAAEKKAGLKVQALWSALFFGAYHIVQLVYSAGKDPLMTVFQVVDAAVVGWYFFWVDYGVFSGSVVPSILLHMLNNLFSAFVSPNYEKVMTLHGVSFFCAALAIEILGYAIFVGFFSNNKDDNNKFNKKKKKMN